MTTLAQTLNLRTISWRTLLHIALTIDVIVLVAQGIALSDRLALGLAGAILFGAFLSRVRPWLADEALLSGVFGIISLHTLTTSVSNLLNGAGLAAVAIPAALAATSLTGLTAALYIIVRRGDIAPTSRFARFVPLGAVGFFVLMLGLGLIVKQTAEMTRPADLVVGTHNMAFSQPEIIVDSGEILLELVNRDLFWHTLTIDELGVDIKVAGSATSRGKFTAAPGTYRFYCATPGHEVLGMKGTLIVR